MKGPNGKSVFIPVAGHHSGTSFYNAGEQGTYWISTPYESDRVYYLVFTSGYRELGWSTRDFGRPVRAVSE